MTIESRRSYCRFCIALCGIVVDVDTSGGSERVLRVRGDDSHPASHGYTCAKGRALGAWHHDPRRLDRPAIKGRGAVGWDECLDDLGTRLQAVIAEHGVDAVGFHFATGSAFDASGRRVGEKFVQKLGTRSKYTSTSIDTPCKPLVSLLMSGHPGLVPALDFERAPLTVLIGCNPVVSHGHLNGFPDPVVRLRALAAAPRELWVIDPRRTETAKLATRHLAPRPGTDYAVLAFAVRELLANGASHTYLDEHAEGLSQLQAAVEPFTADRAADLSGVSPIDLADFVAAIRRHGVVAAQTGTGTTMSRAANVTEWLTWALHVITHSYERVGGMWFHHGFLRSLDARAGGGNPDPRPAPGPRSRPELPNWTGEYPCATMVDEIETGNLRALVVFGGNPLRSFPEPERLARALARLDVLAVLDVVDNDITAVATHVLPCTGQLERADIPHYVDQFVPAVSTQYTPAVVAPGAERRPGWWIMAKLAAHFGIDPLGGLDPDDATDDDVMAPIVARSRGNFDDLRDQRFVQDNSGPVFGWVEANVLPGGRWRLAPEPLFAQLGELAARVPAPLELVSRREHRHLNSQMADGGDEVLLLIHPDDANQHGVGNSDAVEINGTVVAKARLTADIRRGAVSLPHGFGSPNVCDLTSTRADVDPLTGMPLQTGIPVTLRAIVPENHG